MRKRFTTKRKEIAQDCTTQNDVERIRIKISSITTTEGAQILR